MFCGLDGEISEIFEDSVSLKVNGISYLVQIAESLLGSIRTSSKLEILIETRFKVEKIVLFGFLNSFQQFCFNSVSSISGVNDRVALNISGYFLPTELLDAISPSGESKKFKISGVGAKTWEKIIFSLQRNKNFIKQCNRFVSSNDVSDDKTQITNKNLSESEATEALINIGINKHKAVELILEARRALNRDNVTSEELVRLALNFYSKVN